MTSLKGEDVVATAIAVSHAAEIIATLTGLNREHIQLRLLAHGYDRTKQMSIEQTRAFVNEFYVREPELPKFDVRSA